MKLWYITCQSRNVKEFNARVIQNKCYVCSTAFKYGRAIKEMGISANYPLCSAFTVLTKQ